MFESFLSVTLAERVGLGYRPSLPMWTKGQFAPDLQCPLFVKDAERRMTEVAIVVF